MAKLGSASLQKSAEALSLPICSNARISDGLSGFPGVETKVHTVWEDLKLVNFILWGELKKWDRKNAEIFQYILCDEGKSTIFTEEGKN